MDPVYKANKNDPEITAAIKKARKTFPAFLAEADADLCLAIPVVGDAMVKLYITHPDDPDTGEHLWGRYLGHDPEDTKRFLATLLNTPRQLPEMSKGDESISRSAACPIGSTLRTTKPTAPSPSTSYEAE